MISTNSNEMKILLLGYSNLAKKRILNHFIKKKYIVEIASISHKKKIKNISVQYSSYDFALKKSNANLIYISLPNSLHFKWAHKALSLGYHVVVDKPLCSTQKELDKLIKLSIKNKKLIAEATFFNYHKQFRRVLKLIGNLNNLKKIYCSFIIPMPTKNSILQSVNLNGGALMDMGPYAASVARIFCNEKIISKHFYFKKKTNNLIIAFKIMIIYKSKLLIGIFKFGGEYKNQLELHTEKKCITINRDFSPPTNENLNIKIKKKKKISLLKVKKDDCFANFFDEVIKNIKKKNIKFYIERIKFDSNFRNNILKNKTIKKFL